MEIEGRKNVISFQFQSNRPINFEVQAFMIINVKHIFYFLCVLIKAIFQFTKQVNIYHVKSKYEIIMRRL